MIIRETIFKIFLSTKRRHRLDYSSNFPARFDAQEVTLQKVVRPYEKEPIGNPIML